MFYMSAYGITGVWRGRGLEAVYVPCIFFCILILIYRQGFNGELSKCMVSTCPLEVSVMKGNVDIVRALLMHGANPTRGSKLKAAYFGRRRMLNILLDFDENVDISGCCGIQLPLLASCCGAWSIRTLKRCPRATLKHLKNCKFLVLYIAILITVMSDAIGHSSRDTCLSVAACGRHFCTVGGLDDHLIPLENTTLYRECDHFRCLPWASSSGDAETCCRQSCAVRDSSMCAAGIINLNARNKNYRSLSYIPKIEHSLHYLPYGTEITSREPQTITGLPKGGSIVFTITNLKTRGSMRDALIFECGASGQGTFLGLRDSGRILRLRAGDGGKAYPGPQPISERRDGVVVIDVDSSFLFDGRSHTLRVYLNADPPNAYALLEVDGTAWAWQRTSYGYFKDNQFQGGDGGSFIPSSSTANVCEGEPSSSWGYSGRPDPPPRLFYHVIKPLDQRGEGFCADYSKESEKANPSQFKLGFSYDASMRSSSCCAAKCSTEKMVCRFHKPKTPPQQHACMGTTCSPQIDVGNCCHLTLKDLPGAWVGRYGPWEPGKMTTLIYYCDGTVGVSSSTQESNPVTGSGKYKILSDRAGLQKLCFRRGLRQAQFYILGMYGEGKWDCMWVDMLSGEIIHRHFCGRWGCGPKPAGQPSEPGIGTLFGEGAFRRQSSFAHCPS